MTSAQRRASRAYRDRLAEAGLARFEILARAEDKVLLRALARRLAEAGDEAGRLRALLDEGGAARGGVLRALRRSPAVGAGLEAPPRDAPPRDAGL
jgi:hypothetical protein